MTDQNNYQKGNTNPKASNDQRTGGQQNPQNPTKQPWKEKGTPPGQKGQYGDHGTGGTTGTRK